MLVLKGFWESASEDIYYTKEGFKFSGELSCRIFVRRFVFIFEAFWGTFVPEKCNFLQQEVIFRGHVANNNRNKLQQQRGLWGQEARKLAQKHKTWSRMGREERRAISKVSLSCQRSSRRMVSFCLLFQTLGAPEALWNFSAR